MKEKFLGVDKNTIETKGAVSEEVVIQMAENIKKKFETDYSIAVSGIAGPGGVTPEKPVGTVWVAIATPDQLITRKLQLGSSRERVIMETAQHVLNMLRKILTNSYV